MQLEKQVISLELAKKLKELGVKQESLFEWYGVQEWIFGPVFFHLGYIPTYIDDSQFSSYQTRHAKKKIERCAAFTVAELGEMLPKTIKKWLSPHTKSKSDYYLNISWSEPDQQWRYVYSNPSHNECIEMLFDNTEADARAKMLIYLIENKLIAL